MTQGRLIAVVGPSGVGKDSVMAGIAAALPAVKLVRRSITRAPDLGGEDYDALTPAEFESACVSGAFCVHWSAHGLHYGIPVQSLHDVVAGTDCLANFSRSALAQAARVFAQMTVINVTARPETLAKRLAARGRETEAEIAKRLGHANKPLPQGLNVIHLSNDGPIEHTVTAAVHALQPVRG